MNLYKNSLKIFSIILPFSLLVIDTNLPSDNSVRFRKNVLGTKQKLIMTIDDEIKDEILLYDIKKEAAKISALLSAKIDKYEYLTGEEILPSDQSRIIIEQLKFTYSPLGKAFEKQIKTIKEQGETILTNNLLPKKMSIKDAIAENTLTEKQKLNLIKLKK